MCFQHHSTFGLQHNQNNTCLQRKSLHRLRILVPMPQDHHNCCRCHHWTHLQKDGMPDRCHRSLLLPQHFHCPSNHRCQSHTQRIHHHPNQLHCCTDWRHRNLRLNHHTILGHLDNCHHQYRHNLFPNHQCFRL